LRVVDPNCSLPMRPFECQQDAASNHGSRDVNIALIPRCAEVMTGWLRQKRHFDFAALSVVFVVLAQEPVAIVEREDPRRFGGDLVAEVLCLENAGQFNVPAQGTAEPLLLQACVQRIQLKTPVPVERSRITRVRWLRGKDADDDTEQDKLWLRSAHRRSQLSSAVRSC